jgi:hypothetical protein
VLKIASVEIEPVLRQDKICKEKPEVTQKLVLETIQICFTATQKISKQATQEL